MEQKRIFFFDIALVCFLLFAGIFVYSTTPKTPNEEIAPMILPTDNMHTTMTTTTPEGLTIEILQEGTGPGALAGQTLLVDYTGTLSTGEVFDSSIPHGEPFAVHLGKGEVIRGWDIGLLGMKVGEKRKLTIPSELAYGQMGFPGVIPENATLTFEITLRAIQ